MKTLQELADAFTALAAKLQELTALAAEFQEAIAVPSDPPPDPWTHVTTADELTAALQVGGPIKVAPGAYATNLTIAAFGTRLDASGAVFTPADTAKPVLSIVGHGVSVTGGEFVGGLDDRSVVRIGSNAATAIDEQPHDVTLDGVFVHPAGETGVRGIEVHGVNVTIRRCTVTGFLYAGRDSQAIWINNTNGGGLIENCMLSASGEVVMFGGDTVRIPGAIPTGWLVRGNTLFKPQEWFAISKAMKNTFEIKNGQDIVFENNVLDGNRKDAQDGSQLLLTPRNQYGDSPWCVVRRITIRGNVFKRSVQAFAINILGTDNNHSSGQTADITIEGNYFEDSRNGIRVTSGVAGSLVVRHNTFPAITGNIVSFDRLLTDGSKTPLHFVGNVARSGQYGASFTATSPGLPSLQAACTLEEWDGNVIEKTPVRNIRWPSTTLLLQPGDLAPLLDVAGRYVGTPEGAGI